MSGYVSDAVVRRLPAYYRHLRELETQGVTEISSRDLGERMQLNPCQIRQDINSFGGFGRQGFGYSVEDLKGHIRKIMGLDQSHRIVVLGVGRTGQEIANHPAFADEGFPVAALFDADPAHPAQSTASVPAYPESELEARLPDLDAQIAVLALPAAKAQEMLSRLRDLGIRAIWNISPVDLHPPRDMAVASWHLHDTLQILSYRINRMEEELSRR